MKALYRNADILILDEPTAVLTPQEAQELFEILRRSSAEGMSIIFITHKLNEVLDDRRPHHRASPRQGRRDDPARRRHRGRLARLMVGREVLLRVDKKPATPGEPLLEGRGPRRAATTEGSRRSAACRFDVRAARSSASPGVDGQRPDAS